jgi:hypothetical protein
MNNTATFTFNLNIETNVNIPIIVGISIGPPVLSYQPPPVAPIITQVQRPINHITRIVNELNNRNDNWYEMGEIGNIDDKKETVDWQKSGF